MNGPGGYYAKQSKSERERQMAYDLTCMWNLKNRKRRRTRKKKAKFTDREEIGGRQKLG